MSFSVHAPPVLIKSWPGEGLCPRSNKLSWIELCFKYKLFIFNSLNKSKIETHPPSLGKDSWHTGRFHMEHH